MLVVRYSVLDRVTSNQEGSRLSVLEAIEARLLAWASPAERAGTVIAAGSIVNGASIAQTTVLSSSTMVLGSTVLASGSSLAASTVLAAGTSVI